MIRIKCAFCQATGFWKNISKMDTEVRTLYVSLNIKKVLLLDFYLLELVIFMISQANSFRQMATFPLRDETHGGEDVSVYAVGPQV